MEIDWLYNLENLGYTIAEEYHPKAFRVMFNGTSFLAKHYTKEQYKKEIHIGLLTRGITPKIEQAYEAFYTIVFQNAMPITSEQHTFDNTFVTKLEQKIRELFVVCNSISINLNNIVVDDNFEPYIVDLYDCKDTCYTTRFITTQGNYFIGEESGALVCSLLQSLKADIYSVSMNGNQPCHYVLFYNGCYLDGTGVYSNIESLHRMLVTWFGRGTYTVTKVEGRFFRQLYGDRNLLLARHTESILLELGLNKQ